MHDPDFERAKHYALERLERELAPNLRYHSLGHTRDEVAPAAERLAALSGVAGEELMLLRTAAYYHDLGFVLQSNEHEAVGARMAAEILPTFGYSPAHIEAIVGMIMATRLPQTPHNLLEELLADADLDLLGREVWWGRNQDLRAEMAAAGIQMTDQQWYRNQVRFLETHRYWTGAARALRDERKRQHIEILLELLAACETAAQ